MATMGSTVLYKPAGVSPVKVAFVVHDNGDGTANLQVLAGYAVNDVLESSSGDPDTFRVVVAAMP